MSTQTLPKVPDPNSATHNSTWLDTFFYDNKIVRDFGYATLFWGVTGMLIGVIIAFQLAEPAMNMGTEYTTFGRVRPSHTNAFIFAFVGSGIFMGSIILYNASVKLECTQTF